MSRLPRLDRLGAGDWLLLGEALLTLAWASLAIDLLPFRRVAAAASRPRGAPRVGAAAARRIKWAVEAWGRRVPWKAVCFQRGLAAHVMLRRRGLPSLLHYGVASDAEGGLKAHVWISLDGALLVGGEEASAFTCLATFPAPASGTP
jgi:hypothetical protein